MKLSGLCFLAVAAAVIALSEAEECPSLADGEKKFLPHETDCHKYYECTKAKGKKLRECPNTGDLKLCFDKTEEACVATPDCCKPTPGEGDDGSCPTNSKCKMYFSDDVVEVCVKKTGILPKFY